MDNSHVSNTKHATLAQRMLPKLIIAILLINIAPIVATALRLTTTAQFIRDNLDIFNMILVILLMFAIVRLKYEQIEKIEHPTEPPHTRS